MEAVWECWMSAIWFMVFLAAGFVVGKRLEDKTKKRNTMLEAQFLAFVETVKAEPTTAKQLWLVGGTLKEKEDFLEEQTKRLPPDISAAIKSKTKMLDRLPAHTTKEEAENLWLVWFD